MTTRRPRRTNKEIEQAIETATFAEINEVGYQSITFEGVARKAEISKHVLYRRYPSRAKLVLNIILHRIYENSSTPPQTGSLRNDLLTWLTVAESQSTPALSATLRGVLGEVDKEGMKKIEDLFWGRIQALHELIITPAIERGELHQEIPTSAIESVFRILRDRALFGSLGSEDLERTVDEVLLPLLTASQLNTD